MTGEADCLRELRLFSCSRRGKRADDEKRGVAGIFMVMTETGEMCLRQSTTEISGVMVTLRARELPTGEVATERSQMAWRVASSASAWT